MEMYQVLDTPLNIIGELDMGYIGRQFQFQIIIKDIEV